MSFSTGKLQTGLDIPLNREFIEKGEFQETLVLSLTFAYILGRAEQLI